MGRDFDVLEKEEINHKEIRKNALVMLRSGMISKEEYILVVDADLRYEAGLDKDGICLDVNSSASANPSSTSTGRPPSNSCCGSPAPSACPIETEDNIDPITFEELGEDTFTFMTPQGFSITYNLESLVKYIHSTGDFRDPVTRFLFTQDDMASIDNALLIKKSLQALPSLKSIRDNAHHYCIENQKKEECQNLEACLGEIIGEMLDVIVTPVSESNDKEEAENKMYLLLSELDAPFKLLKALHIEQAHQVFLSWKVFLKGHPKKPTKVKGPRGILKIAIDSLESLWTEEDDKLLKSFQAQFN